MKRVGPALASLVFVAGAGQAWPLPEVPLDAGAQAASETASTRQEEASHTDKAAPTRDVLDVVREWRGKAPPPAAGPEDYRKWMFAGAPVLSYGPTTGAGLGVAGNLAVYRGFPDTTRISSVVASVIATTKGQLLVNAKYTGFAPNNHWHVEGDNRIYWTSQETFGLGTDTQEDDAVLQKYDHFRFYQTLYRRVGGAVFLGAGLLYGIHRDVRPGDDAATGAWPESPYARYSEKFGFDLDSQTSAGFGLNVLLDDRDSSINPSRGWYAGLTYRLFFEGFLGGTSSWQQLSYDARNYVRLSRDARHRLALWLYGDFVTAGTAPYLHLPATGMDTYGRSGRGYPQGRFRGEKMLYGELEYRWTVTGNGLFGIVLFLNGQTLTNEESGEELLDSLAPGAGFGLRLMLNKRSRTNLCFDIGFGKEGSRAVYFAVQEAF